MHSMFRPKYRSRQLLGSMPITLFRTISMLKKIVDKQLIKDSRIISISYLTKYGKDIHCLMIRLSVHTTPKP
jgi:hypothetical protein